MGQENRYKLRIQNCISTILDIYDWVQDEFQHPETLPHLEELHEDLGNLDMTHVSEADVRMVEQATNALLAELQPFFDTETFDQITLVGEN